MIGGIVRQVRLVTAVIAVAVAAFDVAALAQDRAQHRIVFEVTSPGPRYGTPC